MPPTLGVVIPAYEPDLTELSALVEAIREVLDPDALRIELDAADPATVERCGDLEAAGIERNITKTATIDRCRALEVTVAVADRRRGKGAAITQGFEALDTDVLAFVDADGSVPASSLADVVEPVAAGEADLAVGSRRHPAADVRTHQSFLRRRLGDAFAALAGQLITPRLHDYQCGAKAIRRGTWEAVRGHLYEPGFAWDVELIAMAGAVGARIVEVPVTWIDRPASTVDTLATMRTLGRALVSARRRAARLAADPAEAGHRTAASGRRALVEQLPTVDE